MSESVASISPFFIVGTGRSGTTMLRRLLNRHSQVCVPEETHFFVKEAKRFTRLWDSGQRQKAVTLVNQTSVARKWHIALADDELDVDDGFMAYARAVDLFMCKRARQDGKTAWGEKTPAYLMAIPSLSRLFPEARFIHIYRDGRAVATSVIPLSWGPNNSYSCARWYQHAIDTWYTVKPSLGDNALELSYEAFVHEPEVHLKTICNFLDLPYEAELLAGYTVHTDRIEQWQNRFYFSERERRIFEAVASQTLLRLGYELTMSNPKLPVGLRLFSIIDNVFKQISNRILRV